MAKPQEKNAKRTKKSDALRGPPSKKPKSKPKKTRDPSVQKDRDTSHRPKRGQGDGGKSTPPQLPGRPRKHVPSARQEPEEPVPDANHESPSKRTRSRTSPQKEASPPAKGYEKRQAVPVPRGGENIVVSNLEAKAAAAVEPAGEGNDSTTSAEERRKDGDKEENDGDEVSEGGDKDGDADLDSDRDDGQDPEGSDSDTHPSGSDDDPVADEHVGEDIATPIVKSDSTSTRVRITASGEKKYWMTWTRKKVSACAPSRGKSFMLYLPMTPPNTGSAKMINEDLNLQELALSRGGPAKYSEDMAFFFNTHHRKAKSQLNRSIVIGMFDDASPYQVAKNVSSGKNGPMALLPAFAHLNDIAGLQKLLASDSLYCDEKFHAVWVGLFGSGVVFGSSRANPKDTLDMMVDVDYEAHARYELHSLPRFRLPCPNPHPPILGTSCTPVFLAKASDMGTRRRI